MRTWPDGRIDRLLVDDHGAIAVEPLGRAELPEGHVLTGAFVHDERAVVLTNLGYSGMDHAGTIDATVGNTYVWSAPLDPGARAHDPASWGTTLETGSGVARVCWPPRDEPATLSGWTWNDAAVEVATRDAEPDCVYLGCGACTLPARVRGTVPGVGRVLLIESGLTTPDLVMPTTDPTCQCDDGLPCTDDVCDAAGQCVSTPNCPSSACAHSTCTASGCSEPVIDFGVCVIDGQCLSEGTVNPDNACESCHAGVDPTGWSPRTFEEAQDARQHQGARLCADAQLGCVLPGPVPGRCQVCDPDFDGLSYATQGTACDDGDPCSTGDTCDDTGFCVARNCSSSVTCADTVQALSGQTFAARCSQCADEPIGAACFDWSRCDNASDCVGLYQTIDHCNNDGACVR